jgi:hypothetical protein
MVKQHIPKPPEGVRDMRNDLSKDYPDDISRLGTVGTFKILKSNDKMAKPLFR